MANAANEFVGHRIILTANGPIVIVNGTRTGMNGPTLIVDETGHAAKGTVANGTVVNQTAYASASTVTWVDTVSALSEVVDALIELPTSPPSIYLDLEGVYLSRYGSISILQIYVYPTRTAYLIDVHSLGKTCFSTAGKNCQTLKHILESPLIPKVFFDVRGDSDALFVLFDISLYCVFDLQLMEFATRTHWRGDFVRGLDRCVLIDSSLSPDEKLMWETTKNQGRQQFSPDMGGSYEVLNERPLRPDIINYCVQDVSIMPILWAAYDSKITEAWKQRVVVASKERVWMTHAADYVGMGSHMALAPLSLICPNSATAYKYFYLSYYPYYRKSYFYHHGIATADATDRADSAATTDTTDTTDSATV